MSTVLLVGIILIALLAGVSLIQWLIRRRQLSVERRLPHVDELADLALQPSEYPDGYHIDYRGPLTSERIALESGDTNAALDELDEVGRLIGYRQAFRSPRSYGEITDVILNRTFRSGKQHRLLNLEITLYEDPEGAQDAIDEPPPPPSDGDPGGFTIKVSELDGHGLDFAQTVRQWSRIDPSDRELQRKVEVRWRHGRIGCVVAGDSEPPGAVEPDAVYTFARRIDQRVAESALAQSAAETQAAPA